MKQFKHLIYFVPIIMLVSGMPLRAQIGSGWSRWYPESQIDVESGNVHTKHGEGGPGTSFTYKGARFSNVNWLETYELINTQSNRIEREWVSGVRYRDGSTQWEAEVNVDSRTSQQFLVQIFAGVGGMYLGLRVYQSNGGTIRWPGKADLATGIFGRWVKINIIHDLNNLKMMVYIDGVKKIETGANPPADYGYNIKYGCYGTLVSELAKLQFRNVKVWRGGSADGGTPSCGTASGVSGDFNVNITNSENDGNCPINTIDNDLNTRWAAQGNNQWITYDLGSTQSIAKLDIAFYKGNERTSSFDIQVSNDNTTWTTLLSATSSGTTLNKETFNVSGSGRYVRILGHGNSVNDWNSISELDIYRPAGPAAPTALSATAISSSQINLSWTDNASNETQFRIERSTNGGTTWALLANAGANVTTYSNTGLSSGTTYHYRVRAENAAGNSAFSNIDNATTSSGVPIQPAYQAENARISQCVVESNHIGFNGTGFVNYNNVTGGYIEWDLNVASAGTYNLAIRYANASGADRPVSITVNGTVVRSSLSFPVTTAWTDYTTVPFTASLNAGINTLRATAITAGGGPNTDELQVNGLSVTPPAMPGNLTATAISTSQINLSWTDNSTNEANFRIERSTNAGTTWVFLANASANATTYQNTGLTAATTYHYRIRAENTGGSSAFSNIANATTQAAPSLQNVALSKPVTASGSDTNLPAHAVDGDNLTRWSASPMPQWLEVDLGALYDISKTEVIAHLDRAYQFTVQSKTTATGAYTTIVNRSTNTTPGTIAAPISNTFSPVAARYVRITVTGAANYTGTWASIVEFRVFGVPSPSGSSVARSAAEENASVSETEMLSEDMIVEGFPNPSDDAVKIVYNVKKAGRVRMTLYSHGGNVTNTLVDEKKDAGTYEVIANLKKFPSGLLIVKMISNGKLSTLKLMKK